MEKIKRILLFLFIILLFVCNNIYADDSVSYGSTLRWSYIINRHVTEGVSPFFADSEKNSTESVALNLSSGLDDRVAHLGISTNRVSNFNIKLTFLPMKNKTNAQDTSNYYYFARVYSNTAEDAAPIGQDLRVNASDGVSVEFPGRTAYSSDYVTVFYYPIGFSLGEYVSQYNEGTYEGTVMVEIIT